ncbi:MAG: type IV pilus twitching motility protein PilT [Acidimicrobiales bacterium]
MEYVERLNYYLGELLKAGGSDLHIKPFSQPWTRVNGALLPLPTDPLSPDSTAQIARVAMGDAAWERFKVKKEADFAYRQAGLGRFRVNAFIQRGTVSMVFRSVSIDPPTTADLGLPDTLNSIADQRRGLVLVTGPTGSGKTSTLAAMVDHVNATRHDHIVTIEDPIEVLHRDKASIINQREIGMDTESFAVAMRAAMRQDPDVILVGEMRDVDTVTAVLQAAETGHLVFSTLHTIGAAETIVRIVDFFPPHLQQQIRVALAGTLRAVICQRLVRSTDGKSRYPALEIMINNGRVMQCILDPAKTYEIGQIVAEGGFYGMRTFDQSLIELFRDGKIALEEAMEQASNAHDLKLALTNAGLLSHAE